jgi:hypothetical protein
MDKNETETFFQNFEVVPLVLRLIFGISLLFLTTRFSTNMLITPSCIILSIGLFLVATRSMGMTIDQLKADGWLLGPLAVGETVFDSYHFLLCPQPNLFDLSYWSLIAI